MLIFKGQPHAQVVEERFSAKYEQGKGIFL